MASRDPRIKSHYDNALKYGGIIRQTLVANKFKVGERAITWRPDDCGFTITYQHEGRRLSFVVTQVVRFCRVDREPDGLWVMYEGDVLLQDDTWMLLRWLDSGFPPQLPEARTN